MAKGNRDVELVIRAKNEASKALGAVSSALDELTKAQQKVSSGSDKTSSLLTELGATLGKLNQQIGGMSTLDRISSSMDRAASSVARLEQEFNSLSADQAKVSAEVAKTERAVTHLSAASERLGSTLARQKGETQAAGKTFNDLTREVAKAERGLASGQAKMAALAAEIATTGPRIESARERYRALAAEIIATQQPSQKLKTDFSETRKELLQQTRAFERAKTGYATTRQHVEGLKASLTGLRASQASASAAFQATAAAQEKTAGSLQRVDQRLKDTRGNLNGLKGAAENGAAGVQQLQGRLEAARQELTQVAGTTAQAEAALARLGTRMRQGLLGSLADAQKQLQGYRAQWQQTQAAIKAAALGGATPANSPEMAQQVRIARAAKTAYDQARAAVQQMRTAIREAGSDVTKLGSAQATVNAAMARMKAGADSLAAAQQKLAANAGQAAGAQDRLGSAARNAAAALEAQQRHGREAMTWVQRLRGELIALTLAYTGLYGSIQQLSAATDVYRAIEAAQSRMMVAFGGNQATVAKEMAWIRTEAQRLGIEIGTLAEEYSKFAVATRGSVLEGEQTRRVFTAVSEAARVNKLSLDQIKGTYLALTQMVSKGTVSMEELRQQLGERLPGAFTLAARAMGMSGGELSKLIAEGKLATEDFLPKFAAELEKTFSPQLAQALESLATQIGQFENTKFNAREVFNQGGWIEGFRDALESLNEYMNSEQGQSFFYNLGAAAGEFVRILAELPQYLDEIVIVLSVLAGLKTFNILNAAAAGMAARFVAVTSGARAANSAIAGTAGAAAGATAALGSMGGAAATVGHRMQVLARWVHMSTVNMTGAQAAAWGLSRAMGVLRGVMAALGGLPGIIVTGLSVAFGYWLTSTNDVIDAVGEHQRQMMAVLEAYDQAKDKAEGWATAVKGVSASQAAKAAADLRKQMQSEVNQLIGNMETDGLGRLRLARGDWGEAGKEVFELFRALERGETTVAKVRKRLDEMVKASEGVAPELQKAITNQADLLAATERTERAFADQVTVAEEMGVAIDGVSPAVRSLQRSVAEMAEETDSASDQTQHNADRMKKAFEEVEGAIGKLTDMVPELAKEWKYLESLKGIDEIFNAAIATAELNGLTEAVERLKTAREAARGSLAQGQVTGSLVDRIVGVESSGDRNAKNPNSTATGLGQFIEGTWVRMFKQYFPDRAEGMSREAMLALRTEAELSRKMVELYARENAKVLQDAGVAVNDAAVYLAHFLGPQGAVKVLTAHGSTPIADLLSEQVIAANESVLRGRTASDVVGWAGRKVGTSDAELEAQKVLLGIEQDRAREAERMAERQEEFNTRLRENASLESERTQAGKQRTLEQEQQLAITKAENDARRAGVTLEESTRQAILESTRLKWEQEQAEKAITAAKKEQEEAEQRLSLLQQHRRDLMEGMELALQSGNTEQYAALKEQLLAVETQLRSAIDAQIKFWEAAIGGPDGEKAAAAITSLKNLRASLLEVEAGAWPTANAIGNVFGQHLVSGVNGFLDKIRETGDVLGSLREAFLQFASDFLLQIAKMIAQQAIFNALTSAFGGAGGFWGGVVSAVGAGVQHTGGIAGAQGNRTRSVSPAWFSNAVRYHTGGIAGLKPNEVPSILEKGEEVLTERDPRHVNNGGGAAPKMDVKVVNAIDAGSFISAGVEDVQGQKAILNFIRANSGAVRGALGV